MEYEPTLPDLLWARALLAMIADGGTVVFPRTALIFSVSHRAKSFTLLNPEILADSQSADTYAKTQIVMGKLGYVVSQH